MNTYGQKESEREREREEEEWCEIAYDHEKCTANAAHQNSFELCLPSTHPQCVPFHILLHSKLKLSYTNTKTRLKYICASCYMYIQYVLRIVLLPHKTRPRSHHTNSFTSTTTIGQNHPPTFSLFSRARLFTSSSFAPTHLVLPHPLPPRNLGRFATTTPHDKVPNSATINAQWPSCPPPSTSSFYNDKPHNCIHVYMVHCIYALHIRRVSSNIQPPAHNF